MIDQYGLINRSARLTTIVDEAIGRADASATVFDVTAGAKAALRRAGVTYATGELTECIARAIAGRRRDERTAR